MTAHSLGALVTTLRRRPGVEAALVLSRDGLVITQDALPHVAVDELAAHVPLLVARTTALGGLAGRGALQLAVLDLADGGLLVSPLSAEATLLVLTTPACDRGGLVSELRRHRLHLAALA